MVYCNISGLFSIPGLGFGFGVYESQLRHLSPQSGIAHIPAPPHTAPEAVASSASPSSDAGPAGHPNAAPPHTVPEAVASSASPSSDAGPAGHPRPLRGGPYFKQSTAQQVGCATQ